MCGIGAFYIFNSPSIEDIEVLHKAIKLTELRGRDAFGCYHIHNGKVDNFLFQGPASEALETTEWWKFVNKIGARSLFIWNCRAHPLPEEDCVIQPVEYDGIIIAHNGTINNDKQLLDEFNLRSKAPDPWVDTYIVPMIYREYTKSGMKVGEAIIKSLSHIEGGIAAVMYDTKLNSSYPEDLWLIKNFKPLTWGTTDNYFVALSEKEMVQSVLPNENIYSKTKWEWVEPYTLVHIDLITGLVRKVPIQTRHAAHRHALPTPNDRVAAVMCSGGLDSSTAAVVACKIHRMEKVYLCNFDYGHRARDREWEAVRKLEEFLRNEGYNVEAVRFDGRWLGELGKSPLTDTSVELPKEIDSVESTKCWVPARNLVFLSAIAAFCEAKGIKWIYTGMNLEESGCLPNVSENTIMMADGTKKLPAEVKVGDKLLAWDEVNNKIVVTEVKQVFKRKFPYVYRIRLRECGSSCRTKVIYASPEHPFYVKNKGWIRTEELQRGDILFTFREAWGKYQLDSSWEISDLERLSDAHGIMTYNFYCEPYNNFFVGEILTHNSYPDNDVEAFKLMNTVLDYFTLGRIKLVLVLERLMKYEIVTLGHSLGLDYSFTWSCDDGQEHPCGICGCCWTRQHALRMAGIPDKQRYLNKPKNLAPWMSKQIVRKADMDRILRAVREVVSCDNRS